MTKAGLERLVKKWKPILGLSDWDIEVVVKKGAGEDPLGLCGLNNDRRYAKVSLRLPHPAGENIENTIVHEMLHCYFWPGSTKTYGAVRTEQGIDLVAALLVKAYGERPGTEAPGKPERRRRVQGKGRGDTKGR